MEILRRYFLGIIVTIFWAGCLSAARADEVNRHFAGVTAILSQVRQSENLPDTVHRNPLVLKAAGLFLKEADSYNLSDGELHSTFRKLFPHSKWRVWVPQFEIRKVKKELYFFSLAYAASTQESSLYLFHGSAHLVIDSGNAGLIEIKDVKSSDSRLEVTYVRTPGSTRPDEMVASLIKKSGKWRVSKRKITHWH
ncbi:MAG: hypothetical protein M0Z71_11110 [Nitrospiraceae bacterium]|nr:hypothetical protein [Nitrospiraceae bacterium]